MSKADQKQKAVFELAQKHSGTVRRLTDDVLARLFYENWGTPMGTLLLEEALYRGTQRNRAKGGYKDPRKVKR